MNNDHALGQSVSGIHNLLLPMQPRLKIYPRSEQTPNQSTRTSMSHRLSGTIRLSKKLHDDDSVGTSFEPRLIAINPSPISHGTCIYMLYAQALHHTGWDSFFRLGTSGREVEICSDRAEK